MSTLDTWQEQQNIGVVVLDEAFKNVYAACEKGDLETAKSFISSIEQLVTNTGVRSVMSDRLENLCAAYRYIWLRENSSTAHHDRMLDAGERGIP